VAPVVVMPDTASKRESAMLPLVIPKSEKKKGSALMAETQDQLSGVSRNA